MLFFQISPRFQRFDCKVFLTDALRYMSGAPQRVMIDNTHVVVLRGTAREMIPVPEMEAFAERFGFRFVAHQIGNANRSARVERPFSFIENNFQAGLNATYKKYIRAVPRELFALERLHLKPLSAWIPEVYRLHQRTVDVEGYVSVNSIRDSTGTADHTRRTGHAGDRRVCGGAEAKGPQSGSANSAATVAVAEGISARAVPGRGPGSRPVWSLRSGPAGAHDSAPRGARLLSAAGYRLRSP
jgi:hypothetical protein